MIFGAGVACFVIASSGAAIMPRPWHVRRVLWVSCFGLAGLCLVVSSALIDAASVAAGGAGELYQ